MPNLILPPGLDGSPAVKPSRTHADNLYENAAQSLYNAIRGDPDGAVRSLVASRTLSPSQHRTLVDEYAPESTGLIRGALSVVTNPLVLIGAAASYKWPILDPRKMARVGAELAEYGRWIPGPLRKLLGLNEIFVGTPIPRVYSKIASESHEFMARHFMPVGDSIMQWRRFAGRTETAADQVRWAMLAEPWWQTEKGLERLNDVVGRTNKWLRANGRGAEVASKIRPGDINVTAQAGDELIMAAHTRATEGIRSELSSDPDLLKRVAGFMRKGGSEVGESVDDIVKWIDGGFFPRVAVRDKASVERLKREFAERVLSDPNVGTRPIEKVAQTITESIAGNKHTKRLTRRTGVLPPMAKDLELLGDAVSPEALRAISNANQFRALVPGADGVTRLPGYSLRYSNAMTSYGNSVSRAYAWNARLPDDVLEGLGVVAKDIGDVPTLGNAFRREIGKVESAERLAAQGLLRDETGKTVIGAGLGKTELLKNIYLPSALGIPTFKQTMRAMEWGGVRQVAYRMLETPAIQNNVPSEWIKRAGDWLSSGSGWSFKNAGGNLAGYFYLSALGLNVGSATQNLLQPILTTGPVLGMGATMRGITSVLAKAPEFVKLRQAGVAEEEVIRRLFPDFAQGALDVAPLSSEILSESAAIGTSGLAGLSSIKSGADKVKAGFMSLFRGTELFNRLSTFEAARLAGTGRGLSRAGSREFAQEITNITQLWAGPAALPTLLQDWPPLLRQFASFPMKFAGFAGASIAGVGGPGGPFNPGTLGRTLAYSAGTYELVKEVTGADISRSLVFGAIPSPEEYGAFAPFPVVPPAVGIAGSLGLDLARGEGFEETKRSLPLLVPGGLQAARIAQVMAPDVAQSIGRGYADPSQRRLDGRIPVYSTTGQLTGYKTDFELFAGTAGIPGQFLGSSGETKERELFKYILGQRDQIREMRRQYIEALLDNDVVKGEALARQYIASYGVPIEVRPQDIKAAERRRELPRLDRLLGTLPKDVRPVFQQIAAAGLSGDAQNFVGVDPSLLGTR